MLIDRYGPAKNMVDLRLELAARPPEDRGEQIASTPRADQNARTSAMLTPLAAGVHWAQSAHRRAGFGATDARPVSRDRQGDACAKSHAKLGRRIPGS